ncbi:MAG TPA: peptidoglycan-binding domain-containing protein [Pirellulales bacterium]|nr:peptidoglycan-binding domain-containing protein [Pirellulales bacterium]
MPLKASFWDSFGSRPRLNQAATQPFHSIHISSRDNGTDAVAAIQAALAFFASNPLSKFAPLFPDPSVAGFQWGPFVIAQQELDDKAYGTTTEQAVIRFQKQTITKPFDGKAGMDTLTAMDEMMQMAELQITIPSSFQTVDI